MADETCTPCNDVIDVCISTGPPGPRGSVGKITQFIFYPAVGTTDITGTDKSGALMEVDPDGCLVSINGVMLEPGADYTIAADGLTVTLSEGIVNANDVLTVQTWKSDEQSSNDVLDLKLDVEKNTSDIAGLDVRVTQNEDDIAAIQGTAQNFTTRDVKVSGVNTTRAVDEPLQTQQDVNVHLDKTIAEAEERIDTLESGQPTLEADLEDLRTDVDENTQGISDTATALNDLTDVVSDNVDDITSLQNQVNNLPPPTDISELSEDVDDIAKQVGSNTIAISKNTADIAALPEMTIDLEPLSEAIETNAAGISKNASDIKDIKGVDAKQQGEINDIKADVVELQETEFDLTGLAVVDEDNKFTASQTIKDGVTITGSKAFLNLDKGSPLSISNGNFSNSVVEIKRSTGDTAISLEASGHIRGVKTDADPSCAVSLEYFQANVGAGGGDVDMSLYATKLALTDEEKARILGDEKLAADLANAILTEKYNDQELRNKISAEEKARASGDSILTNQIASETQYRKEGDAKLQAAVDAIEIPDVNLEGYATEDFVTEVIADFATENFVEEAIGAIEFPELPEGLATETYVAEAIDAIEFPACTVISDTAPTDPEEGSTWYDTVRLELFVFASGSWLPSSPLGARVEQGEVLQAQILSRVEAGEKEQDELQHKVKALEGAVGEHTLSLTVLNSNPRPGEFNLKDGSLQLTTSLSQADYITLSRTDKDGNTIDLNRITEGDVLRLSDELGETAELKITASADGVCSYKKISGELEDLAAGGEPFQTAIDFVLLSSFDPEGLATVDYVDARDNTKIGNTGEQILASSNWKIRAPASAEGDNGKLSFINIKDDELHLYHIADPTDDHHAAPIKYIQENYAGIETKNDFTGTNKFKGLTYFDSSIISKSDTFMELKGDADSVQNRFLKLRGNADFRVYAYPGDNNDSARNAFSILMKPGDDYPVTTLNYLQDPVSNGHAVNKRYLDQKISNIEEAANRNVERTWSWQPEPAALHRYHRVYWHETDSGHIRFSVAGENYRDNIQFPNDVHWQADANDMLTITGILNSGKVGILAYGLVSRFQMYETHIQLECEPNYMAIFKPDMFKNDHKITVKYGSLL